MASIIGTIWAVDIGNSSLKALKLSDMGGYLEVVGFAKINHDKTLSGKGVSPDEQKELIALSLNRLVTEHNIGKEDVIISIASQNSFARFVTLPPVEIKRIPEIIRFEAAQQIPFDISEVQWDWQMMSDPGDAEKKVGLFAIKNEIISSKLDFFENEGVRVAYVQMSPMALYNYILCDRPDLFKSESDAIAVIDIGADATDLVVCTSSGVWQRSIAMGGNAFTRAISDAFRLNFEKAENLKRTAAISKYARQIFQAMRPVFSDLASEIQRSLGFYTSSNPNVKVTKIIALGGGTKMRGLLKYLQQTLQINIEQPDSFKKLSLNEEVSAAEFHDNVSDFGVVYGLAVQALGYGKIENNLLPKNISRKLAWSGKSKVILAASIFLLIVSLLSFGRTFWDRSNYMKQEPSRKKVKKILNDVSKARSNLSSEQNKSQQYQKEIDKAKEFFKYKDTIPKLNEMLISLLPNENNVADENEKKLFKAFKSGDLDTVFSIPREERKQLFVTNVSIAYSTDIAQARFDELKSSRRRRKSKSGTDVKDRDLEDRFSRIFSRMNQNTRGGPGRGASPFSGMSAFNVQADAEEKGGPGFVVTIGGYSPYKNIAELLDPPGVTDDVSRWGYVTKLLNLDKVFDANVPFQLYSKEKRAHFDLQIGVVTVDSREDIPPGIGIIKTVDDPSSTNYEDEILVDPMTQEQISAQQKYDEFKRELRDSRNQPVYDEKDHWFVINFKLSWTDGPPVPESSTSSASMR